MILSPEYCEISSWMLAKNKSIENYYKDKSLLDFLRVTEEIQQIRDSIFRKAQYNSSTLMVNIPTSKQANALDSFTAFTLLDWPKDEDKIICFLHNVEYYLPRPLPKTMKVTVEADGQIVTSIVNETMG